MALVESVEYKDPEKKGKNKCEGGTRGHLS